MEDFTNFLRAAIETGDHESLAKCINAGFKTIRLFNESFIHFDIKPPNLDVSITKAPDGSIEIDVVLFDNEGIRPTGEMLPENAGYVILAVGDVNHDDG